MTNEIRAPYKEKYVKDLKAEDIKVAISGTIISKGNGKIAIDDGTGSIIVSIDTELDVNSFIKVYGNLLLYDEGFEIQGHFIKDLNNVDKNLYRKAMEIIINSK